MKETNRTFSASFFRLFITIPATALYLICLSGWYVPPEITRIPALLSPAFVWCWLFLWPLMLWWGKKNKAILFALAVLTVGGLPTMAASFSLAIAKPFPIEKANENLRVMQWNCMNFPGAEKSNPTRKNERKASVDFINQYQPDIICLQDFTETRSPLFHSNLALLRDTLGYVYEYVESHANELRSYGFMTLSNAIFSKKPILGHGALFFPDEAFPEAIVWIDVALGNLPVRIVTTHFSSMHFTSHKHFNPTLPYHLKPDSGIIMSPDVLKKMNYYLGKHIGQSKYLRDFLDSCSIPVVLAADLNIVPAHPLYKQVRGQLQDGFLGSKTGMGNTYNYLAPNLRIDYLFNDKRLKPVNFHHFTEGFFDHDHLLADYAWRKP
jgi:endonuclease/exonuclease/phosphatase family metal-dependent hydrolase